MRWRMNVAFGRIPRSQQRHQEFEDACRQARAASQRRKLIRRRWKREWVDILTAEFERAGDTRRVFALHRELGIRDAR